jgi:hypothetical protein
MFDTTSIHLLSQKRVSITIVLGKCIKHFLMGPPAPYQIDTAQETMAWLHTDTCDLIQMVS